MKCTFIHFTIQIMPNYGKERDYFSFQFFFETKKILKQLYQMNRDPRYKTSNTLQTNFLKAITWDRVSFPKRKTTNTQYAYAIYFFQFLSKTWKGLT